MKIKFMITCREAARLLSDKLEYPLPLYKRIYLRMHLAMCSGCSLYGRQIKALKNLVSRRIDANQEISLSSTSSLSDDARHRMKSAINKKSS